jgi:phosphoglycerate dehydrogenase-like enzyme
MRVIGTRWSIVVPREEPRTVDPFTDPPWLEPIDLPPDIVYPAAQLHDVLAQSDIVVSILPLTRETHHTFKDNEFGVMRRGAIFVNIGRGPVVDEAALLRALRSGHLYGAALDVFEAEPLPRQHPLWNQPNIIVSPHLGGMSDRTRERAAQFFAVNLSRYLDGEPLLNEVDRHQEY